MVDLLSAAADVSRLLLSALFWCGVVILSVVAMGIAFMVLRRKLRARPTRQEAGFSMESLEKLRALGQISEEEFRIVRRNILGLKSQLDEKSESILSPDVKDDDGNEGPGRGGRRGSDAQQA